MGAAEWLEAARQAHALVEPYYSADPGRLDPELRFQLFLGSCKAPLVFGEMADGERLARNAAAILAEGIVADPEDPRLFKLPAHVEESPEWRPFGNLDIITTYRACWLAAGLRAMKPFATLAADLEAKILAHRHPAHGGFPNAFGEFPHRTWGVHPTFMVMVAVLAGRRWDEVSPAAQAAVRGGARFLMDILDRNRHALESGGTYYPELDEGGRLVTEDHPRFDRTMFFLHRVRAGEPVEHIWLVAGASMAGAEWARSLADSSGSAAEDVRAAVNLALAGFEAAMKCARPLENLSVGKLIATSINLKRSGLMKDRADETIRQAADFLSREGEVRDGGRTRWYWERYHPKPAMTPCPDRLTANVCDYSLEIAHWLREAAKANR